MSKIIIVVLVVSENGGVVMKDVVVKCLYFMGRMLVRLVIFFVVDLNLKLVYVKVEYGWKLEKILEFLVL